MFYLLFSFLLASGDLAVKSWIHKQPKDKLPKQMANGYVEIRKETNQGFAGSRMEEQPELVQKLSGIALGILTVIMIPFFLSKKLTVIEKVGLSFLMGGAISNTAERNLRGYVVDYIHVNVDKFYKKNDKLPKDVDAIYREAVQNCPLSKITFNLADMCIVIGAVIVGAGAIIRDADRQHKKAIKKAEKLASKMNQ